MNHYDITRSIVRQVSFSVVLIGAFAAADMCRAETIVADIALVNGQIIDGSGQAARKGDVAIRDGKIVLVDQDDSLQADWSIDCSGLIVCPGFIDLHNHSDGEIENSETRAAINYVTQGCTTMVTGNCGSGPVDVGEYYDTIDKLGAGTNIAHLIPQGSLRRRVLDSERVEPTEDQLSEMRSLTKSGMQQGAWGMSSGLIYVPSSFASTEELAELAKVVASHGGIYASHIRGEGTMLLDSVTEALQIGRESGAAVHISHFKSTGRDAWGLVREAARMIADQRDAGRKITADQYPYIASSTSLAATVLPSWAREGGGKQMIDRLENEREKMDGLIGDRISKADDGKAIRIASYKRNAGWIGKSLAAIAAEEEKPVVEIAKQILRGGGASIVKFSMAEADVRHIMAIDWVATASDGGAKLPGATRPHPRNYGTFPRKIGYYAIAEKVIPIEHAIRSMTGLPAEILSMKDRGLIRDSMAADIVVFDPETVRDTATFDDPHQHAIGIQYVFVGGTPTLVRGRPTGALPGRALRFEGLSETQPNQVQ